MPDRKISIVANLGQHLTFVSDSQDVKPIQEHIGLDAADYDAFFVAIKDGDYTEVWGIVGKVPFKSKLATRFI